MSVTVPMMWGFHTNGFGMMVWWVIMTVFWLGVLAVAVWALVRLLRRPSTPSAQPQPQPPQSRPPALDLLNACYARGEMDTETYRSMCAELEMSTPDSERSKATLTV